MSEEKKSCCPSKANDQSSVDEPSVCSIEPPTSPDVKKSFFTAVKDTVKKYSSVIGVFGLAVTGGAALATGMDTGLMGWMHYSMGLTFLNFALLKMNDIGAFADSFGKYDLLARKSRAYGLSYPFIEAGMGASYLAYAAMPVEAQTTLYAATLALTTFGTAGVVNALKNGQGDLKCACVGGDKDLPLSRVAVAENISMGAMAAVMLAQMAL